MQENPFVVRPGKVAKVAKVAAQRWGSQREKYGAHNLEERDKPAREVPGKVANLAKVVATTKKWLLKNSKVGLGTSQKCGS